MSLEIRSAVENTHPNANMDYETCRYCGTALVYVEPVVAKCPDCRITFRSGRNETFNPAYTFTVKR